MPDTVSSKPDLIIRCNDHQKAVAHVTGDRLVIYRKHGADLCICEIPIDKLNHQCENTKEIT